MKKYFALYMAPVATVQDMMKKSTKEDMEVWMDEWKKWMKAHEKNLPVMGNPLGKTKRFTEDGVTDVQNDVTGYSIVEAESQEEAAKLFKGHPHFKIPGAYIDVLDIMPVEGM